MPEKTIPLSERYRPKKISEIKGQEAAVEKIRVFIDSFIKGSAKKNAVLLHGPAGTGKTTLAHVFANELNYELFELNASDLRNRQKLDEVLKPSTLQKSLFAKGKVILVDEADGVTATDFGGLQELILLIEKTKFPVIVTCNDVWQNKFSSLRSKCELIPVKEVSYATVLELLREIAKKEDKIVAENIIAEIAAKSRGDLRAALNDLQSVIHLEGTYIKEDEVHLREKTQDIFNAMKEVFKLRTNKDTIKAYDSVDLDTDQITLWLEENIPAEYRGEELAKAFNALSKADIFKGRIHRQQYWHFMTYQNFFLTAGISAAKGMKTNNRFTRYSPPKRILKIWMINQKNARKKTIASKFAELTHTSKKRAMRDFNILSLIIDEDASKTIQLEDEEKVYLAEKKQEVLASLGKVAI